MLKKKPARHQLVLASPPDFDLIGICCGLKDYQVGWTINKLLELKLEKSREDLILKSKDTEITHFPLFDFNCEKSYKKYVMAGNKNSKGYLAAEFKHMDYFLVINDESLDYNIERIIQKLNEDPAIISAIRINPKEIKARKNFAELLQF